MVFVCHLYRELSNQHSENLRTVLKYVIYNELSNTRNPNNMVLLSALFQNNQETAAKVCLFFFFIFSRSFVFKLALALVFTGGKRRLESKLGTKREYQMNFASKSL